MASLRAHFVRPDEHDRLTFHPRCPRCRDERLEGSLTDGPLVPLRAQAAIAVGVLACTSVAPTAAFATGVDDEMEGTAAPGQLTPDMDAEGELDATEESEAGPVDVPSQPAEPVPVDDTSDEQTPQPSEPVAGAGDTIPEVPEEQPAAVVAAPPPPPPPTEPQPTAAQAGGAAPSKDARRERAESRARAKSEVRRVKRTASARVVNRQVRVTRIAAAPAPPVTAAPAAAVATAPPSQPRTVAVATRVVAADAGDASHVVQRGESLWSIAADRLPEGASPAQIAREVNRLWEQNKSRIGTGDRNLLMAGTRLDLR